MNVLLVAEESAGVRVLQALARTPPTIRAVMTRSTAAARTATVAGVAATLDLDVWPARDVRSPEMAAKVRAAQIDLILNVHSLYLMHPAILEAVPIGAFNLHPGALPRYAGLNCPSWAVYRGERSYGVTMHRMVPRIDAGDIAYQKTFPIDDRDTGLSVSAKCVTDGRSPARTRARRDGGQGPGDDPVARSGSDAAAVRRARRAGRRRDRVGDTRGTDRRVRARGRLLSGRGPVGPSARDTRAPMSAS
jgi:UDP-4-amino-4-deoxy-L-arabinose formyltransferase/UDP-glucuronic acid dehydrogenase (UDP-4-keto-hexauronic acid decarboxylating)